MPRHLLLLSGIYNPCEFQPPHSWSLHDHTQGHTTVGRTPLDKWSARRRDLYLTTHNTHNRQTSMPPAGFEPAIPAGDRPQTHALDRSATGIGNATPSSGILYLRIVGKSFTCDQVVRSRVFTSIKTQSSQLQNNTSYNVDWHKKIVNMLKYRTEQM